MKTLYTSLSEIKSFGPSKLQWEAILAAQEKQLDCDLDYDRPITLADCLESYSINNVWWLLEKRKTEIDVIVSFARKCADSVAHIDNSYAIKAATSAYKTLVFADEAAAILAAATAVAYAADAYAAHATAAAYAAATAATDAYAAATAAYAATADAYAAYAADAADAYAAGAIDIADATSAVFAAACYTANCAINAIDVVGDIDADVAAREAQQAKNKQFLLDAIKEYEDAH